MGTPKRKFHLGTQRVCEECGYAYKGEPPYNGGVFPLIKCPSCKRETHNFDEAHVIEELEKTEGFHFDYVESEFEVVAA